MKFFVTGVGGQLGHDVMNGLYNRGYEGVGSDIAPEYSGAADGSPVTKMPYVAMDITDANAVKAVLAEVNPDVVIHCAAWTAVDMAEDDDKVEKVRVINAGGTQNIASVCNALDCKMITSAQTMCLTDRERSLGSLIAPITSRLMSMGRQNWKVNSQ